MSSVQSALLQRLLASAASPEVCVSLRQSCHPAFKQGRGCAKLQYALQQVENSSISSTTNSTAYQIAALFVPLSSAYHSASHSVIIQACACARRQYWPKAVLGWLKLLRAVEVDHVLQARDAAGDMLSLIDEAAAAQNDRIGLVRCPERFPAVFSCRESLAGCENTLAGLLPAISKQMRLPRLEYKSIMNQGDYLIEVDADRKDIPRVRPLFSGQFCWKMNTKGPFRAVEDAQGLSRAWQCNC